MTSEPTPPSATALFERDGERFVATELSRGPWDPRHCHGGPVGALLTRAVEGVDGTAAAHEWQIARVTIELLRPVPVLTSLDLAVGIERPGRKVSLVAATLHDGDMEVARMRALRIRTAELALPDDANRAVDAPLAPPASGRRQQSTWATGDFVAFHSHACELRFVGGGWDVPGPVEAWVRLLHPVLDGEAPTGVQRAVAAADFGNGISGSLPFESFVYINPDLTVHLLRPPSGEWIGMRTASRYGGRGAGLAESELFDGAGRVGRSCQSLFVDAR